jgi:hypothetical protein
MRGGLIGWPAVHGRLAAGIARRPWRALAANLAVLALAAALAPGAVDRLAVAGGLGTHLRSDPDLLIVATDSRPALGDAVTRQALTVIRARLDADTRVAEIEAAETMGDSDSAVLVARLAELSASERQRAAEELAEGIDPGPLEVAVGGETMVQRAARDRLEDELPGLALLALPLIAVALVLAFGVRQAAAPLLASATGALGAIAILGLLARGIDLGAAGLVTATAVALAVGAEACAALRRDFVGAQGGGTHERIGHMLTRVGPGVVLAAGGGALASLATIAIALPAARSAAIGGALAALLAGGSALVAMPSVLALAEPRDEGGEEDQPGTGRIATRLRDLAVMRPWLAWVPVIVVAGALVIAGAHAFDPEAASDVAGDIPPSSQASRAAEIGSRAVGSDEASVLFGAPERAAPIAREEIASGLPWVAGLIVMLGLLTAYAEMRSARTAFVRGSAAALPALAVVGLLVLVGKGNPPLGIDLGRLSEPQVSALLVVLAAVGAISTLRGGLGDAWTALPGTVVAGAALAALGGSDLSGAAQAGVAVAAGLVVDLVVVRAVLVPSLDRALPFVRPRVRLPHLPSRLRR